MDAETKKQLKLQYKQTVKPMGVFRIVNLVNGKSLVGSSLYLDSIYTRHKFQLNHGGHKCKELARDWKELGEHSFAFEVLETIEPDDNVHRDYNDELKKLEEKWLAKLQPYGDRGYNKPPGTRQ